MQGSSRFDPIAVFGIIIAAIACIAAVVVVPEVRKTLGLDKENAPISSNNNTTPTFPLTSTPQSTETLNPVPTPSVPPTKNPTITPIPTETPIPTPTSIPDTSSGSVLQKGGIWRQGKLEFQLSSVKIHPKIVILSFTLTNRGSDQRIITYGPENFSATDNNGRQLSVGGIGWNFDPYVQESCRPGTDTLDNGQSTKLYFICDFGSYDGVGVQIDTSVNEIIVTASGISSINNAQWRVSIPR